MKEKPVMTAPINDGTRHDNVLDLLRKNVSASRPYGRSVGVTVDFKTLSARCGLSEKDTALILHKMLKRGLVTFRERKTGGKTLIEHMRVTDKGLTGDPNAQELASLVEAPINEPLLVSRGPSDDDIAHDIVLQHTLSPVASRTTQVSSVVRPIGGRIHSVGVDRTEPRSHGSVAEGGPVHMSRTIEPDLGRTKHPGKNHQWDQPHAVEAEDGRSTVIVRCLHCDESLTYESLPAPALVPDEAGEEAEREANPYYEQPGGDEPTEPGFIETTDHRHDPEALLLNLDLIRGVLTRAAKREAAIEASDALTRAGLEDMALAALTAIPDDTDFETQVLVLLARLGVM